MSEPNGRLIRKFRLVVLGPSFVGKTQLINRFINNGFSPQHEITERAQIYRRAYNILEDQDEIDPQYVEIELMDVFPHDHPLLDQDENYSELAKEMSQTLNHIVKNSNQ